MPGDAGAPGLDGVSVVTSPLDAGSVDCPHGGVLVTAVNGVRFVCNGSPGSTGPAGNSVSVQAVDAGSVACPTGGVSITSVSGTQVVCNGAQGPAGNSGPITVAGCPSGMTTIDLAYSTLCYARALSQNWDQANAYCSANFRSGLCSLRQWRAAVCESGITSPGRTWLDVPVTAATYATVQGCTGDSVSTANYSLNLSATCCHEWPKY